MPLISKPDQERLRQQFEEKLVGAVRITLSRHNDARPCRVCSLTEELLSELASLSDALSLEKDTEQGELLPAIALTGRARHRLRFFGLPSGFELPAFIDSILDVSRGRTSLGDEARERLARLDRNVHIKVFTTPT